jgi:hypothetical protein
MIVAGASAPRRATSKNQMFQETAHRASIPALIVVAAAVSGAVLGLFQIANTSIGWHLASGDWMVANRAFLRADPFSFTSGGTPWIDHSWLFQLGASMVYSLAGSTGLVLLRALTVAVLAILLLFFGVRSGLSPAAAAVLAVLCVAGARGRFFVRPELATLLIVPAAVWLFLLRTRRSSPAWLAMLAALMVLGANSHGAVVVVPPLLAGILAAEIMQMALTRNWDRGVITSGVAGIAIAAGSMLINPYGWRLFGVPMRLARLVDQAHIPNPEWTSPTPYQAPTLYAAIAVAVVVLALKERRLAHWALFLMASILALRHIRNLGLFFVLLPLAIAPALATWHDLRARSQERGRSQRRVDLLAVTAVLVLALSMAMAPRFGLGFADDYYPEDACAFLDAEGLPRAQLYNDVRFGGYLIHRYGPQRKVFQDDRNEIHAELLRDIWRIFQASDVSAWTELLIGYDVDTALVRYHPPVRVTDPAGSELGLRGFSTLWFPAADWALVYWDDVAMVFVRRDVTAPDLLKEHEFRVLRPDDLAYIARRGAEDHEWRRLIEQELVRAIRSGPENQRAARIAEIIRP